MAPAESPPSVRILRSSILKPLNPPKPHLLALSGVDIGFKDFFYIGTVLFYKTDIHYAALVDILKRGLLDVLVRFYPMAGRLVDGDDGLFALSCNGAGVEFVEASSNVPFSELEQDHFAMRDFFADLSRFCTKLRRRDNPQDPLLSVQVTRFSGGGIAVGSDFNHATADGHSIWHFMNSWAECCQGVPVSIPPLHIRFALNPPNLCRVSVDLKSNGLEVPEFKPSGEAADASGSPLNQRVLHLTVDMIHRIKKNANAEAGNVAISSFQALTAYLWKRRSMAQAPPSESEKLVLNIPVNVRDRLIPPLTDAYFGNALVVAKVIATAGELRRESLGATAARIHEAIRSVTNEYIQEDLSKTDSDMTVLDLVLARWVTTIVMSPRFPVYDTDFGWGKPAAARYPAVRTEGFFVMYPGKEEGSVDVCLALRDRTLKAFVSQEDEFGFSYN